MAEFTDNFRLELPAQYEYYDIDVQNENMKKIDTAIKNVSEELNSNETLQSIKTDVNTIKNNIGNTNNSGGTATSGTVSAKLNKLLTDYTTTRATKIDNIGNSNDSGGNVSSGSVSAKLNKLLTDYTTTRATKIDNIGNSNDSGGTTTSGTVSAKLNKLLTDYTTMRATKIDNIGNSNDISGTATNGTVSAKLNKLLTDYTTMRATKIDNIGNSNDSGGNSSGGSIFAKLNKLLTDYTTTRASRIDSIYTYTQNNNTANSTGTLSQKLSYIINNVKPKTLKLREFNVRGGQSETIRLTGSGSIESLVCHTATTGSISVTVDGINLCNESIGSNSTNQKYVLIYTVPNGSNKLFTFSGTAYSGTISNLYGFRPIKYGSSVEVVVTVSSSNYNIGGSILYYS